MPMEQENKYARFEVYGVKFTRVTEEHLEMMRNWRNSDFVRSRMLFQEHITPEMQSKWFQTINNDANYYFIVEYMGKYVGVINIKDIKGNAGEPGFYLVNEEFKNTSIASLVNLAFGEFLFEMLGLDKLYIHVRKDNADAMKLNLFFGYKIIEAESGDNFNYLELKKNDFYNNNKVNKLKEYITKTSHL